LENAMRETINNPPKSVGWEDGKGRFLIDGFPRKMDQAIEFDRSVSFNLLAALHLHADARAKSSSGWRY
jgi:UMP-CMP kinase